MNVILELMNEKLYQNEQRIFQYNEAVFQVFCSELRRRNSKNVANPVLNVKSPFKIWYNTFIISILSTGQSGTG